MGMEPVLWMMAAGLALSAASGGYQVANAQEAKKDAKKQEEQQKMQLALQKRVETARAKRVARIKAATIAAGGVASGIDGSSMVEGGITGVESSLSQGLDTLNQQTALQSSQIEMQTDRLKNAANVQIGQAIGSFASQAAEFGGAFLKPSGTVNPATTGDGGLTDVPQTDSFLGYMDYDPDFNPNKNLA